MYTDGKIIIQTVAEDLIRDGHSIVESFEEVREKTWCKLWRYMFDKAKKQLIERIKQVDKDSKILYVNDISIDGSYGNLDIQVNVILS